MGSNPASGTNGNGHWGDPPTEGGPMIQNRTLVEDQLMIAELRLYKNRKKNTKKQTKQSNSDSAQHSEITKISYYTKHFPILHLDLSSFLGKFGVLLNTYQDISSK